MFANRGEYPRTKRDYAIAGLDQRMNIGRKHLGVLPILCGIAFFIFIGLRQSQLLLRFETKKLLDVTSSRVKTTFIPPTGRFCFVVARPYQIDPPPQNAKLSVVEGGKTIVEIPFEPEYFTSVSPIRGIHPNTFSIRRSTDPDAWAVDSMIPRGAPCELINC